MNEVRKRMRAWAPKSRSGCLACKHRRVRCDEGRPRCKPCEKRNVDCVYLAPKTWLFEGKAAQQDSSSPSSAVTILSPPVTTPWGSAEETRALQFFLERAAPWLSGFSPFDAHTLWSVSVPRIAAITPAIKSLLTAFTLLEIPIRDATTFELRARSQAILRHYTHGLHQLRKPSLSTAESSLGPVLAWAIEVHNLDHKRAQMHIHGAKVLHARVLQSSSRNLSHEDYVHDTNLEDLFAYMNMWHWIRARILPPMLLAGTLTSAPALAATSSPLPSPTPTPTPSSFSPSSSSTTTRGTRTPTPSSTPIDIGLTTSLTTLNTHITPTHSSTVRAAFVHYFSHIHTPSMTPLQLDAARFYLLGWERTIFQNKYLTKEASVVFNALNLLCNLAAILLPVPLSVSRPEGHGKGAGGKTEEEDEQKAEGTIGMGMSNIEENTKRQEEEQNSMELALGHILRRCEWMVGLKFGKNKHGVEQGDERDAEELRETVELVLRVTRWLAPIEGPRRKAGEMLREMGVEGSGERGWERETSERHGVFAFG